MKIALGIEYDGAHFRGWQTQSTGGTVQDALDAALSTIAGQRVTSVCAGRTDTGVHGLGQVVHFETSAQRPLSAWVRGVNSHLPDAAAVLWATPVADDFHARFSAVARTYRYVLLNHPVRPAVLAGKVGWCHTPLDEGAMAEAARYLVGEHDFTAFRAAECQARSPVRTVHRLSVQRMGQTVLFEVTANAFLHHMIRNLVGSLVYVGNGRQRPEWVAELLAARDRHRAAPTFSPAGLYLCDIDYGDAWPLPGRGPLMPPVLGTLER